MGSGTSTQSTQSQSVNQIPAWVTNAGEQNYAFAQDVASRPLTQYQGQMLADVSPQTQQAWNLSASSGNVGQDQYQGATSGFLNSLGQTPISVTDPGNAQMIRAGQLSNTNLTPYMNPYTQNVINATLPIYQQNLALQQNQAQNAANSANAFGGSRQAIQQGVTQAAGAQGMAQMAQQLNAANFGQAQAAAQQDIANRLTASQANQQAQQTNLARNLQAQGMNQSAQQAKINSDILASQGLSNLGDSMAKTNAANFTMLSQAGASQSQQAQNQINAQMAKFNEARNYPQQQLATLLSALGMTPHDTATTGSSTTETTTPTNWGALALGGLEDLSGFFKPTSDRSLKTDVVKLGKDAKTGLQMHAFRYKGDPKSYPKVIGPMAQDVERKFPGKTQRVGGKLTVDPDVMGAAGVQGYADGTENVQPGPTVTYPGGQSQQLMVGPPQYTPLTAAQRQASPDSMGPMYSRTSGRAVLNDPRANPLADPRTFPAWKQYAGGVSRVPGPLSMGDSVPAMLTPGEAVLNQRAATQLGRGTIKQLNAGTPPSSPLVAKAIAPLNQTKTLASFLPPKKAFGAATTAPRAGAKAFGSGALSNTKLRLKGALA